MLFEERFDLLLCRVARHGVTFLYQACQFRGVSFQLQQLIFGQFSPGELGGTDLSFPFAFHDVEAGHGRGRLVHGFLASPQPANAGKQWDVVDTVLR